MANNDNLFPFLLEMEPGTYGYQLLPEIVKKGEGLYTRKYFIPEYYLNQPDRTPYEEIDAISLELGIDKETSRLIYNLRGKLLDEIIEYVDNYLKNPKVSETEKLLAYDHLYNTALSLGRITGDSVMLEPTNFLRKMFTEYSVPVEDRYNKIVDDMYKEEADFRQRVANDIRLGTRIGLEDAVNRDVSDSMERHRQEMINKYGSLYTQLIDNGVSYINLGYEDPNKLTPELIARNRAELDWYDNLYLNTGNGSYGTGDPTSEASMNARREYAFTLGVKAPIEGAMYAAGVKNPSSIIGRFIGSSLGSPVGGELGEAVDVSLGGKGNTGRVVGSVIGGIGGFIAGDKSIGRPLDRLTTSLEDYAASRGATSVVYPKEVPYKFTPGGEAFVFDGFGNARYVGRQLPENALRIYGNWPETVTQPSVINSKGQPLNERFEVYPLYANNRSFTPGYRRGPDATPEGSASSLEALGALATKQKGDVVIYNGEPYVVGETNAQGFTTLIGRNNKTNIISSNVVLSLPKADTPPPVVVPRATAAEGVAEGAALLGEQAESAINKATIRINNNTLDAKVGDIIVDQAGNEHTISEIKDGLVYTEGGTLFIKPELLKLKNAPVTLEASGATDAVGALKYDFNGKTVTINKYDVDGNPYISDGTSEGVISKYQFELSAIPLNEKGLPKDLKIGDRITDNDVVKEITGIYDNGTLLVKDLSTNKIIDGVDALDFARALVKSKVPKALGNSTKELEERGIISSKAPDKSEVGNTTTDNRFWSRPIFGRFRMNGKEYQVHSTIGDVIAYKDDGILKYIKFSDILKEKIPFEPIQTGTVYLGKGTGKDVGTVIINGKRVPYPSSAVKPFGTSDGKFTSQYRSANTWNDAIKPIAKLTGAILGPPATVGALIWGPQALKNHFGDDDENNAIEETDTASNVDDYSDITDQNLMEFPGAETPAASNYNNPSDITVESGNENNDIISQDSYENTTPEYELIKQKAFTDFSNYYYGNTPDTVARQKETDFTKILLKRANGEDIELDIYDWHDAKYGTNYGSRIRQALLQL